MQEHKKISHLTHRNSDQKTIRMQLNPVGKTMDYFQAKQILENDEKPRLWVVVIKLVKSLSESKLAITINNRNLQ